MACEEKVTYPPRKAVIEATFSSGGYPNVLFSSSVVPGVEGNLSEAVVNWGKVTVSDGEREVVLTGKVDNSYLPPFRYTTIDMQGEPGKTYKIIADYGELHAESSVRMPYPVPIDSITFSRTENDSLRAATLHFTSPSETPSFFYISLEENKRGSHPSPCLMGTIRTDTPCEHYSLPILNPKLKINYSKDELNLNDNHKYIPHMSIGEEWVVRLNRVEESVYDFWKAYDNMILFSTSPFVSANESLPTNISNGYGVWSPQGTTSLLIKVK